MDEKMKLKKKKPNKTSITQELMVQESKFKQDSILSYMRARIKDTHK